jgi:hypothetical protein
MYACVSFIVDVKKHHRCVPKDNEFQCLADKYLSNYYRAYPNHAKFEGFLSICNAELYKRLSFFLEKLLPYSDYM